MIRYIDAKYLKHEAGLNDIQVTVSTLNGEPRLFIGDLEFTEYATARKYVLRLIEDIAPVELKAA